MKSLIKSERELAAFNALGKIRALLSAAQFLTSSEAESELSLELISVAEDVATSILESQVGG